MPRAASRSIAMPNAVADGGGFRGLLLCEAKLNIICLRYFVVRDAAADLSPRRPRKIRSARLSRAVTGRRGRRMFDVVRAQPAAVRRALRHCGRSRAALLAKLGITWSMTSPSQLAPTCGGRELADAANARQRAQQPLSR